MSRKGDVIYGRFGSGYGAPSPDEGQPGDPGEFFTSQTIEVDGASITVEDLYDAYMQWCDRGGWSYLSMDEFVREIRNGAYIRVEMIGGRRRFIGIAMKSAKSCGAHFLYR